MSDSPLGPIPSGAEFLARETAAYTAEQEARATAAAPDIVPPSPHVDPYEPYRANPKATYHLFDGDKPFSSGIDNLLSVRGQKDAAGKPYDDYRLSVRDPNGERKGIALRDLDGALAEGFKLENVQEAHFGRLSDENKGWKGDVWSGMASAANQLSFGVSDKVLDKVLDAEGRADLEYIKHEHEAGGYVGAGLGFVGSMFAGGPLFKAAGKAGNAAVNLLTSRAAVAGVEGVTKSLARKVLEGSIKLGAEATVIATPQAVTEAALGDPEHAAESLVVAMGAGAALGVVSPVAKGLFDRAAKSVFYSPATLAGKAEAYANEQAVKAMSPLKKYSKALASIPGGEQEAGKTIRELDLMPKAGEEWAETVSRLGETHDSIGNSIGEMYKAVDDKMGAFIDGAETAKEMRRAVLEPLQKKVGYSSIANRVEGYIEDFESKVQGQIKAGDLWAVRRDLRRLVKGEKFATNSIDEELGSIQKHLDHVSYDQIGKAMGSDFEKELSELGRKYRVVGTLEEAATDNVARKITNRTNSLTDYITGGGLASAGAVGGGFLAGPAGAGIGAGAGKLIGMFGNKYLRENYNRMAVNGAEKLGILFTEQAQRHTALSLDAIPSAIARMGEISSARTAADMPALLGIGGTRAERFNAYSQQLAQAQANSEDTTNKISELTGGIAEGGAPLVAQAATMKKQHILAYLSEQKPKEPPSQAFGPKRPWTPNERELAAYERRVEAAYDPIGTVTRHLPSGTLTREHIEAIKTLYPGHFAKIQARVQQAASDPKAPHLPAAVRARLASLFGAPQSSRRDAERYQAPYAAPVKGSPHGGGLDKQPSMQTDTQRLSGG